MSFSIVYSRASQGIKAPLVTVETHLSRGLPRFSIVGLPEEAVKESKDRVRSALMMAGFEFPSSGVITINLAPADLPKEGGRYDLPIALGILAASHQIPNNIHEQYECAGELALSGELRAIKGIFPFALETFRANRKLLIPHHNAEEASLISQLEIYPGSDLLRICGHLTNREPLLPFKGSSRLTGDAGKSTYSLDLSEVYGQSHARRTLEIAAAGGHSLLMVGPPGTGKTMMASRLPSILPELTDDEAFEVAAVMSITTGGFDHRLWKLRPFRSPHHTASSIALVGGGRKPRPGEISLAHKGVLFLDELPEYSRAVLEVLREPLESGKVIISRAHSQVEFPAEFQLIAAMNPCPCGYLTDTKMSCTCTMEQIQRYRGKLSGPLLDRIDMHIEVPSLPKKLLTETDLHQEDSATVRNRVIRARALQYGRCNKVNAKLSNTELKEVCSLEEKPRLFLENALEKLGLSARSYHRVLKVARTIADLSQSKVITQAYLSEALSYRKMDRTRVSEYIC